MSQTGTTGIPSTKPISLWKKLQQVCGAGARVDSFGADSFDEDAMVLNEAALGGGSVEGEALVSE